MVLIAELLVTGYWLLVAGYWLLALPSEASAKEGCLLQSCSRAVVQSCSPFVSLSLRPFVSVFLCPALFVSRYQKPSRKLT
ncbi:MAG TPA: hypothetical protein DCY25_07020 [Bacteroidales bacterium]|nr:hypothetical protein [Bacteroidales bacterium]